MFLQKHFPLIRICDKTESEQKFVFGEGERIIPAVSKDILLSVGCWLKDYGDSIYGTRAVPVFPYELDWGMFTYKPGKLFMHVFHWREIINIHCLASKITRVYVMKTEQELDYDQHYVPAHKQHRTIINLPAEQPDEIDSVLCLELEEDRLQFDSLDTL